MGLGERSLYKHHNVNVSVLLYHVVCPSKYRRVVFDDDVDGMLREVCSEIATCHEITFMQTSTVSDHVHFLVQSVPSYRPTKIVRVIKSITAREVFARCPRSKSSCGMGSSGPTATLSLRWANTPTPSTHVCAGQGAPVNYKKLHELPLQ